MILAAPVVADVVVVADADVDAAATTIALPMIMVDADVDVDVDVGADVMTLYPPFPRPRAKAGKIPRTRAPGAVEAEDEVDLPPCRTSERQGRPLRPRRPALEGVFGMGHDADRPVGLDADFHRHVALLDGAQHPANICFTEAGFPSVCHLSWPHPCRLLSSIFFRVGLALSGKGVEVHIEGCAVALFNLARPCGETPVFEDIGF